MHVSKASTDQTFGFCRICIPHDAINASEISVIIDDGSTPILYPNYTLYDNCTHKWIYFAYQHSTRKIDIVPEFSTSLLLPVFMIVTLLVVMVYKRKHSKHTHRRSYRSTFFFACSHCDVTWHIYMWSPISFHIGVTYERENRCTKSKRDSQSD